MYLEALKIAYKAHHGQLRRDSCVPYIVHPIRVAGHFNDDTKKTIAILHDVIEDTDLTLDDITQFGSKVYKAVDAMSQRKDEKHFDYIKRLRKNELAVQIKIADVVDNLSDTISIQPKSMTERYDKTLKMLI